jgi:hypothetical protein
MPKSKVELRLKASRRQAGNLLREIRSGKLDIYEGYRQLYGIRCLHNAAVQELRPMFRIPGVSPDGVLTVDNEFRKAVVDLVNQVIGAFEE